MIYPKEQIQSTPLYIMPTQSFPCNIAYIAYPSYQVNSLQNFNSPQPQIQLMPGVTQVIPLPVSLCNFPQSIISTVPISQVPPTSNITLDCEQKLPKEDKNVNTPIESLPEQLLPSSQENRIETPKIETKEDSFSNSLMKDKNMFTIKTKYERKKRKKENKDVYFSIIEKNGEKIFKCGLITCLKEYKSKENLILHFKNKHLKEKPYICQFCNAEFTHRNGKAYHERKVHNNYLHFICPYKSCQMKFLTKNALNYHQRVHKSNSTLA